ncbi:MAG: hypothetical protein KDN18_11115 [Verrucomicrobiae bacterium]|nr:hypothetical protein [Verrucomicrobiae bacterium]
MKKFSLYSFSLLLILSCPRPAHALDAGLERKALRSASGLYGPGPSPVVPGGQFDGTVGNTYTHEHSSIKLRLKPGRGKSSAVMNVWDGSPHITRLIRVNHRVLSGGRIVRLTGGKVNGRGLLPLGIEVRRARFSVGTIKLSGSRPSMEANLKMSGVDLSNMNAPVSGSGSFKGKQ